ncbi:DNA-binding response regulator [Candidatus Epulonipiscium fishelsonii]|uniref:DNA-binding response regulator n=1 Tax=Candidatus Epulonipiscium fishelsonii TaxID=77094 RepID=A0ACC8X8T3_9FIRM|nr:DNA-binding response regulator [Epulopiscium sp. SCG-B11WGA-EpuloA1]ONI38983.1 DNA-binding response regulator [Epulopiscium sp. SCG-B05WGA-EpuloA1]
MAGLKSTDNNIFKVHNLRSAKEIIDKNALDLIILDVNLPDGNGIDFLKEIKQIISTPIILLTANDLEIDIVNGLESGAQDYITKPFSLAILRARVNAQLRKKEENNIFKQDNVIFDFDKIQFYVKEKPIELSKTEQKLLRLLVKNKGIVLDRNNLIDKIWTDGSEYVDENALSVTIKRLRTKLGDTKCIKTIYGIGYMWVV